MMRGLSFPPYTPPDDAATRRRRSARRAAPLLLRLGGARLRVRGGLLAPGLRSGDALDLRRADDARVRLVAHRDLGGGVGGRSAGRADRAGARHVLGPQRRARGAAARRAALRRLDAPAVLHRVARLLLRA